MEWTLAVLLGLLAAAIPVAMVVWAWPAITSGMFGPAVFFVTLAAGLFISTFVLWLFMPLAWLIAAILALCGAAIGLVARRPRDS